MVSTKKGMAQVTTNKNCTASFRNRILAQNDLKCPNHLKLKKKKSGSYALAIGKLVGSIQHGKQRMLFRQF